MNLLCTVPGKASGKPALRFGERTLSYSQLTAAADALARRITDHERVAVWATPTLETAVAVTATLRAGVAAVPLNPRSGERELAHIVSDSSPTLVLAGPDVEPPGALAVLPRITVSDTGASSGIGTDTSPPPAPAEEPGRRGSRPGLAAEAPALIVYTSGTTGPPKGVVLSRRSIASTLTALADAWRWTGEDVVVHGLPLFHVHGLVLGVLGPLYHGGTVHHLGRFSPTAAARALADGGTMLFGVPTMYHRLAEATGNDPELVRVLGDARLLVSGSAPLSLPDHQRIEALTGQRVIERYGMTETLMNTSVRADDPPATGTVGGPLPDVQVRLVDDAGDPLPVEGDGNGTIGEIQVRGPNVFSGYLNQPEATAAAFTEDGWFRTGDMAVRDTAGRYRIVGRQSTDLIKSGGYKIGAGEIENVLLAHPGVAEAAVTGAPDADLGERIVAWIVPREGVRTPSPTELADHVARQLAPHKRPRDVRLLPALPRNDLGKVLKRELR